MYRLHPRSPPAVVDAPHPVYARALDFAGCSSGCAQRERERGYAHTGQLGIAVCETDSMGNTALHHAVRGGQLDAARALVSKGGPITAINADGM